MWCVFPVAISEVDVYIHEDGRVEVTGGEIQRSVVPILGKA